MPEVVVLGTAQDGGVPHAGCVCANCREARIDRMTRRLPASLGLRSGDAWVIVDATSAFEEQVHMLWTRRPASREHDSERYQPPDAVLITHAHTGHYTGLWQLDRSVLAASGVSVLAPPETAHFLAANEPWATMVNERFISIEHIRCNEPLSLLPGLTIEPIPVPHRAEWSTETVCLLVVGPDRSLLYVSDIDFWDEWDRDLVAMVASVDIALLDGTFWARPTSAAVSHPPIIETMDRLQDLAASNSTEILFTHINHSNPAITPGSPEAAEAARRGYRIAREGDAFEL